VLGESGCHRQSAPISTESQDRGDWVEKGGKREEGGGCVECDMGKDRKVSVGGGMGGGNYKKESVTSRGVS